MTAPCPWCSAPRVSGPCCPRCGADYAKAAAIKTHGRAADAHTAAANAGTTIAAVAVEPEAIIYPDPPQDDWQAVSDAALELKFCQGAIPVALCVALVFNLSGLGAALQRMFLTMPVHELGHAVTAWFCGFNAIPTVWKTLIPETRGFVAPLGLAGALGYLMWRAYVAGKRPLLYTVGTLLLIQLIGTFALKTGTALTWIIFGGDGMGMILAILLMGSFYVGKNTQIYQGSLRWGFVVIGAAAFVDIFGVWWRSHRDPSLIPFGTMDGMASDAMKLVEDDGWTHELLISRYFTLGLTCLLALALIYAWGVWRARKEVEARDQTETRAERARRKEEGRAGPAE